MAPPSGYRVLPFAKLQQQGVDWLALMHRQHNIHALVELDVTDARHAIREARVRTGEPLSFTGFIVACLARAIDEDKAVHGYRQGRGRLIVFDDVDVTVMVESDVESAKIPVPHIVRAANRKSPAEISREIRDAKADAVPYAAGRRFLPLWLLVPGFLREFFWARLLADPRRRKRITGTTVVTSVGMFGRGAFWGIPMTPYTVCLTVGGISRKPGVVMGDGADATAERIAVREFLAMTLTFDHDIVEGAAAARFGMRLKELIERGAGISEPTATQPNPRVPTAERTPAQG